MIISIIPQDSIINHFDRVRELVGRCEDLLHPYGTPGDILTDCMAGQLTLWGIFDLDAEDPLLGILVTGVRHYWRISVLELIVLAGDRMKEWLSQLNDVTERYAAELGCYDRLLPGARIGWKRELAKFGFKESKLIALECRVGQEGRQ